jgi:hypothetical protein
MAKPKANNLKEAPYGKRCGYDEDGNRVDLGWELLEYVDGWERELQWQRNEPFRANLALLGFERGRSAARFIWEDWETGTRYPMFMSGMLDLLQTADVLQGCVSNQDWIVVKRGSNYGIERYVS